MASHPKKDGDNNRKHETPDSFQSVGVENGDKTRTERENSPEKSN